MDLLEGGKEGEMRVGERGWGGDVGEREGGEGRGEEGREGRGGEGRGGEGRGGGRRLTCHKTPTYLGVNLDRTLPYRDHLTALRGKVMARTTLIRRLAGTSHQLGSQYTNIENVPLWHSCMRQRNTAHRFVAEASTLDSWMSALMLSFAP